MIASRQWIAMGLLCVALSSSAMLGGCARTFPPSDNTLQAASAEFDVPPREMVEKIRAALATPPTDIGVVEEDRGAILTGFQRFPGNWHIGRRWQEQTRYRITVIPDFDEPTKRSRVEVREVTETRAAEGMRWEPADGIPRPERAQAMLEQIKAQVK